MPEIKELIAAFNLLIWIFGGMCVAGFLLGLYSVTAQCHFKNKDKIGEITKYLCIGTGMAVIICIIFRIALVFVK